MKVYVRFNHKANTGKEKFWKVIFDDSEILVNDIEFKLPVETDYKEIEDRGLISHLVFDVEKVIYKNGSVFFE